MMSVTMNMINPKYGTVEFHDHWDYNNGSDPSWDFQFPNDGEVVTFKYSTNEYKYNEAKYLALQKQREIFPELKQFDRLVTELSFFL